MKPVKIKLTPKIRGFDIINDTADVQNNVNKGIYAGNYDLSITSDWYEDYNTTINMDQSKELPVSLVTRKSSVTITTNSGAYVTINKDRRLASSGRFDIEFIGG